MLLAMLLAVLLELKWYAWPTASVQVALGQTGFSRVRSGGVPGSAVPCQAGSRTVPGFAGFLFLLLRVVSVCALFMFLSFGLGRAG